jgi:phage-related holin
MSDVNEILRFLLSALAVCYLISNEGISVLENLSEIGIEVPFLSKVVKKVRDKVNDSR